MNRSIKKRPPLVGRWIMQKFANPDDSSSLLGDLEEVYCEKIEKKGTFYAWAWYWKQVFISMPSSLMYSMRKSIMMLRSYLKIGLRNIMQSKVYSFINILGLSVAIACTIVIYFFIQNEFSYDTFHKNYEKIYRVSMAYTGNKSFGGSTPALLKGLMKDNIPGLSKVTSIERGYSQTIRIGQEVFTSHIQFVDDEFFQIFDFPLESGDAGKILSDPNTIIISHEIRNRFFADLDPVGKLLSVKVTDDTYIDFIIGGIAKKIPENSSIRFDIIIPGQRFEDFNSKARLSSWTFFPSVLFVILEDGRQKEVIEQRLKALVPEDNIPGIQDMTYIDINFRLQKLEDIHLDSAIHNRVLEANSDALYSYILGGIALLILVIACINFMNLSVGFSVKRTKEVGMRKVLGARRKQLITQFWVESLLLSFFSMVIGMALAKLFMPVFNTLANKNLEIHYVDHTSTLFALGVLLMFTGIVAGSYPALVLSGSHPVKILKGFLNIRSSGLLRRSLVVVQFSLSIFLIVSSFVMSSQLDYMSNKKLGFESEQVLVYDMPRAIKEPLYQTFKNRIENYADLISVSGSLGALTDGTASYFFTYKGETAEIVFANVDNNYVATMGFELLEGKSFSPDFDSGPDAANGAIANETFLRKFDIKSPIGHNLSWLESKTLSTKTIIGVVKDFHFESMKDEILPTLFVRHPQWGISEILFKIKPTNMQRTIQFLEESWKELFPNIPFDYAFLDEQIEAEYRAEENWKRIITYASYLAIFIALLGLFGMTSLSIARRTKEVGIRKVLGSSPTAILSLFNKEYLYLVLLSNVISWPFVYYVMDKWLENFAYTITIDSSFFIMAALLTSFLTIASITAQAFKTVNTNPIQSLRYE